MKLKTSHPSTRLIREPRAQPKRRNLGRWIYIGLLALVLAWAFDVFFGQFFFVRGNGLVVAQPVVVASEYTGTVRGIAVRQGEKVSKGQVLAHLSSKQFDQELAHSQFEMAQLAAEKTRLDSELAGQGELIGLARERLASASAFRKRLEQGVQDGVATGAALSTAYEREYGAREDMERITAEMTTLRADIAATRIQIAQQRQLNDRIGAAFDNGRLVAPRDGIVTKLDAIESSVIRPGDPILTIAAGVPYVLAYFENGSLYDIAPGQTVEMYYGTRNLRGVVTALRPVSDQLPEEFQRSFQPAARAQIAEIRIADQQTLPPLFAKLDIGGGLFSYVHRLFDWMLTP